MKGEIVRDNKRQYFIKTDDRSRRVEVCGQSPKKTLWNALCASFDKSGLLDCLLSGDQGGQKKSNEAL